MAAVPGWVQQEPCGHISNDALLLELARRGLLASHQAPVPRAAPVGPPVALGAAGHPAAGQALTKGALAPWLRTSTAETGLGASGSSEELVASSDEEFTSTDSGDEGRSNLALQKSEDLEHLRSQTRDGCVELCCARLCCSWFCKLLFVLVLTVGIFVNGPLNRPMWLPISYSRGCELSGDQAEVAFERKGSHSLNSCKGLCERTEGCAAIDIFNETHECALYKQPCLFPKSMGRGVASFQIARFCHAPDGAEGILIEGECNTSIQPPTFWYLARDELLRILLSPLSWGLSLLVALGYTYIYSGWLRRRAPKRWWGRLLLSSYGQVALVLLVWACCSSHFFGWPDALRPLQPPPTMEVPLIGVRVVSLPPAAWALHLGTLVVLLLVLPQTREYVVHSVLLPSILLLICWLAISCWYFGWPRLAAPLEPPPMKQLGPIWVPDWSLAQWIFNAICFNLLFTIACPCFRSWAISNLATVGVLVMACFNAPTALLCGGGAAGMAEISGILGAGAAATESIAGVAAGAEAIGVAVEAAVSAEVAVAADTLAAIIAAAEGIIVVTAATAAAAADAATRAAVPGSASICHFM